ncbi:hypothetical protein EYF80_010472 [Liparis tanakae]|uniref:Uncharacterized protein n=1 Tax=Liparis tanakae TaxID=230148 RepID=A0A4Z2IND7_9TELE|nr:hypothetical protein EYF80_010472 [Liparis tanakae]
MTQSNWFRSTAMGRGSQLACCSRHSGGRRCLIGLLSYSRESDMLSMRVIPRDRVGCNGGRTF